jgi:hypothetical protein
VRRSLRPQSSLLACVADGLGAVRSADRACIEATPRAEFADSLDIDRAFRQGREHENRWDYLLGHGPSATVVALEPHSASQDEISTVIAKRRQAREQLADHLKPGSGITAWYWVASGKVAFANTERAMRRLEQNGIRFVGKELRRKHLQNLMCEHPRSARASGRWGELSVAGRRTSNHPVS